MLIIDQMLNKYDFHTLEDRKNAIKEIIQEIVLSGLARTNFFNVAAFYGGTALRIFYGLDRFSEDLDFSLLASDPDFDFAEYVSSIRNEAESLGLKLEIEEKPKTNKSNIKSVFVKRNTKEHFLIFYPNLDPDIAILHADEKIRVKLEIDIDPPSYAKTEVKYRLLPSPYQMRVYDLPSLFASKINAVLSRNWKTRVKGRDLYDYIFYLAREASVNIDHLKARLVKSDFIPPNFLLDNQSLIQMLSDKFQSVDYDEAKKDVLPFVKDVRNLDIWSEEFFIEITKKITIAE